MGPLSPPPPRVLGPTDCLPCGLTSGSCPCKHSRVSSLKYKRRGQASMGGSHPSPALSLPLSSPSRHRPARCSIYTGHFLWEQCCPGGRPEQEGGKVSGRLSYLPGNRLPWRQGAGQLRCAGWPGASSGQTCTPGSAGAPSLQLLAPGMLHRVGSPGRWHSTMA